jgi:hypothetical protein
MAKSASPLIALLFVTSTCLAAIDLDPVPGERILDGIKFPQLSFKQDGKKIVYEQPRDWTYSGGGGSIKFTPPHLAQAQAEIDQSPLQKPQNLDEETVKALQAQVLASVPPNSQKVTLVSEEKNPLLINNNETYAVTISYIAFGQEFQRSVLFLNLPDTQVRFRVTTRKADFEKVNRAFRGSLFSWQWN